MAGLIGLQLHVHVYMHFPHTCTCSCDFSTHGHPTVPHSSLAKPTPPPYLLSYLLEAVQHRDAGDAVDLAEGVQADRVEVLLPSYLCILYDGCGRVVDYHHSMVTLGGRGGERGGEGGKEREGGRGGEREGGRGGEREGGREKSGGYICRVCYKNIHTNSTLQS